MASNNKEILAKAVTDTINSDEPIDLLLIYWNVWSAFER